MNRKNKIINNYLNQHKLNSKIFINELKLIFTFFK